MASEIVTPTSETAVPPKLYMVKLATGENCQVRADSVEYPPNGGMAFKLKGQVVGRFSSNESMSWWEIQE